MRKEDFAEVLGDIDERHIVEARADRKTKKPIWFKWSAMAACLCVALIFGLLIKIPTSNKTIAPGFLVITAYAASSDEEMIMQEGVELPLNYNWSMAISSRPGLPLKLSADEYPNVTFEISFEEGTLLLWEDNTIAAMNSPLEIGNDTTIYWTNVYPTFEEYMGATAYINIVIREEENIVGYAVVKIYTNDLENAPTQSYNAKLLKSVSFPKVNGKYQRITSEYVQSEMKRIVDNDDNATAIVSFESEHGQSQSTRLLSVDVKVTEVVNDTTFKVEALADCPDKITTGNTISVTTDFESVADILENYQESNHFKIYFPTVGETDAGLSVTCFDAVQYDADGECSELPDIEGDTVQFQDKALNKSDLSAETLEWLERYNALSPEEQLAISSIPSDLYELCGYGEGENTEVGAPTE